MISDKEYNYKLAEFMAAAMSARVRRGYSCSATMAQDSSEDAIALMTEYLKLRKDSE